MRYVFTWGVFFGLLFQQTYAQTGPAGVGTSATNVAWFRADKGMSTTVDGATISSWNDQSGNGVNLVQPTAAKMPTYKAFLMNGMPAVEFDNNTTNNDLLSAPDNPILDGTNGYTIFSVTRMKNLTGEARSIIAKRTSVDTDEAFMLFYYTGNRIHLDIDGIGNRFDTSPATYAVNNNYIINALYDGTLTAANRSKIYEGEILRKTATESSATVNDKPSPLVMGATHTGDNRPFGGYVSEVLIYRVALNDACRVIVNNYLSAKYSIALGANDKYDGDLTANGDYDRDVAGVGQESSGNNTAFSSSACAGLGLTVNSGLDNGDYLLAGHNMYINTATATDITVASGGPLDVRWKRIWYIDVTNASAAVSVDLDFDFSDADITGVAPGTVSNYKLLYRSTPAGPWTIVATASSVTGDKVNFSGYSFASDSNDGYYTIGTLNNTLSPLPVQLLYFNAVPGTDVVNLEWATASETNNDYFTVERSADGITWTELMQVDGAGTNNGYVTYTTEDRDPLYKRSYYQLKQTDFDGKASLSQVVPVYFDGPGPGIHAFGNAENPLVLCLKNFEEGEVEVMVTDMLGKIHCSQKQTVSSGQQFLVPAISHQLPAGAYVVSVRHRDTMMCTKVLVP